MKHLGSSLRNPLKYTKQNYIKTNTTLETLKHNFDNFEHDGIGWLVKVVTRARVRFQKPEPKFVFSLLHLYEGINFNKS